MKLNLTSQPTLSAKSAIADSSRYAPLASSGWQGATPPRPPTPTPSTTEVVMTNDKRLTARITLRLPDVTAAEWREQAECADLSVSDWVRHRDENSDYSGNTP